MQAAKKKPIDLNEKKATPEEAIEWLMSLPQKTLEGGSIKKLHYAFMGRHGYLIRESFKSELDLVCGQRKISIKQEF